MKTAFITGAAQGIGRALTLHFLSAGWRVAALDKDTEALAELETFCSGTSLLPLPADAGEESGVTGAFARLADWQSNARQPAGLNLLVNNAGMARPVTGPVEHLTLADWQHMMDSHLTSTFLCSRAAIPGLRRRRGSIVNISSTRALQSEPHCEAYAAAKGGILSLTHALAISLGPDIRVNAICPGWIETGPFQKQANRRSAEHSDADIRQHPAGKVGDPSDITAMVEFLTEPGADFITGQHFVIDGGMTRKMIYAP